MRQALALSYLGLAIGTAISASLASFGVVLFGTFLRAFAGGINWVFSTQLLFHSLPGQVRGRVFASEFAIFTLSNAVSTGAAGWALDRTSLGIGGLLWGMAGLALVPGVLWTLWIFKREGREAGEKRG